MSPAGGRDDRVVRILVRRVMLYKGNVSPEFDRLVERCVRCLSPGSQAGRGETVDEAARQLLPFVHSALRTKADPSRNTLPPRQPTVVAG